MLSCSKTREMQKEKGEGEPGNIIFMTVVTILTITHRGLEVTDLLFLDSKWQKTLPQWLYDLARK